MKKFFRAVAAVMASVCCFGIFASCGGNTITVGYTDYEPMNYKNAEGELVGFDTELAQKVFDELGYKVRFKLIDWANKYSELEAGTIDCVWNGFTANCADDDGVQRADKVDFSYYYMQNAQCVIRLNTTAEITEGTGFEGKSVAFEAGSAGASYIAEVAKTLPEDAINQKGVTSQMDAVREVNAGTAQYAVVDILLAQSLAGQGDFANVTINEGIEIAAEYYAVGFKKGSELTAKVNAKFEEYATSGYLEDLAEKYELQTKLIVDFASQK